LNKIIKIILGVFVLLVIVGLFGSGGNNTSNDSTSNQVGSSGDNTSNVNTSNQVQEPATTSEAAVKQTPETYKVGDRVVVGERAYTITDVRTASSVGDDFTKQTATGIFVIVTMNVENIGKESATMSSTDVKIIDSEGRTFESDTEAWTALKENILLKQIQPGLPVVGQTIFDVPKGITANLQVSSGIWGTDTKLISLGTIQ
jgi:cytoskeletal protein RodZ